MFYSKRRSFMWFYTQAWVPNSHILTVLTLKEPRVQTLILKVQTLKLTVLTI